MELEDQWWKGQLAADIYQALRYKVGAEFGDLNGKMTSSCISNYSERDGPLFLQMIKAHRRGKYLILPFFFNTRGQFNF